MKKIPESVRMEPHCLIWLSCCTLCNGLKSNALRNIIWKNELSRIALVKNIWLWLIQKPVLWRIRSLTVCFFDWELLWYSIMVQSMDHLEEEENKRHAFNTIAGSYIYSVEMPITLNVSLRSVKGYAFNLG